MEYFSLGSAIPFYKQNRFFEKDAWEILQQCGEGLLALSQKNIIHRDVTPRNILIRVVRGVRKYVISDLGSAFQLGKSRLPELCGTHSFAAPESLKSPPKFNLKSDVFGLGMVVVYLFRLGFPRSWLEWESLPVNYDPVALSAKYLANYEREGDIRNEEIPNLYPTHSLPMLSLLVNMFKCNPDVRIPINRVVELAKEPTHIDVAREKSVTDLDLQRDLTKRLANKISALTNDLTTANNNLFDSRRRGTELSKELEQVSEKLEQANKTVAQLDKKVVEMKNERDAETKKILDWERECNARQVELTDSMSTLAEEVRLRAACEQQIAKLESDLVSLRAEHAVIENSNRLTQQTNMMQTQQLQQLARERESNMTQIAGLSAKLVDAQVNSKVNDDAMAKIHSQKKEIQALQSRLSLAVCPH